MQSAMQRMANLTQNQRPMSPLLALDKLMRPMNKIQSATLTPYKTQAHTDLSAIPSLKLVTKNASATVKSARYWLNVTSCVCRNTIGWYVSVLKALLMRATTSDTPPAASSLDSVVWRAT
jgi:hypothetical protein